MPLQLIDQYAKELTAIAVLIVAKVVKDIAAQRLRSKARDATVEELQHIKAAMRDLSRMHVDPDSMFSTYRLKEHLDNRLDSIEKSIELVRDKLT